MRLRLYFVCSALAAGAFLAGRLSQAPSVTAQESTVYELRTYHTEPGRLPALLARFKNHTTRIFEKHGMKNIGYWVPADQPGASNTLIYVLQHKSREAARKSWDGFRADPAWISARTESEKDGKIVQKVESVYLNPTDFSPLK